MPFEADHYEGRLKLVLWNDITLYTLSSRKWNIYNIQLHFKL